MCFVCSFIVFAAILSLSHAYILDPSHVYVTFNVTLDVMRNSDNTELVRNMEVPVTNRAVYLYSVPFLFERDHARLVSDLTALAERHGIPGPYALIQRPLKPRAVPENAVIVVDLPARLCLDEVGSLLAWLNAALDRGTSVLCPGSFDLRPTSPSHRAERALIEALAGHRKLVRAIRIREGLARSRERGIQIGRKAISMELRQEVLDEYNRVGSVRGTARRLKERGIDISRSSVQRIKDEAGGSE
jgi:hypothetical protein